MTRLLDAKLFAPPPSDSPRSPRARCHLRHRSRRIHQGTPDRPPLPPRGAHVLAHPPPRPPAGEVARRMRRASRDGSAAAIAVDSAQRSRARASPSCPRWARRADPAAGAATPASRHPRRPTAAPHRRRCRHDHPTGRALADARLRFGLLQKLGPEMRAPHLRQSKGLGKLVALTMRSAKEIEVRRAAHSAMRVVMGRCSNRRRPPSAWRLPRSTRPHPTAAAAQTKGTDRRTSPPADDQPAAAAAAPPAGASRPALAGSKRAASPPLAGDAARRTVRFDVLRLQLSRARPRGGAAHRGSQAPPPNAPGSPPPNAPGSPKGAAHSTRHSSRWRPSSAPRSPYCCGCGVPPEQRGGEALPAPAPHSVADDATQRCEAREAE